MGRKGSMSDNVRYSGPRFDAQDASQIPYIMSTPADGIPSAALIPENRTAFGDTSLDHSHPDTPPSLKTLRILNGDLLPTSMADRFLQRVWNRLDAAEQAESDVHLRDDLRIAKLCILNVEREQADPWGFAFWTYLGITYPKYLGILAERQAYERSLGPTLAEQLQDPTFLATLDPVCRPFYVTLQTKFDFAIPPKSVPSPKSKKQRRTA